MNSDNRLRPKSDRCYIIISNFLSQVVISGLESNDIAFSLAKRIKLKPTIITFYPKSG